MIALVLLVIAQAPAQVARVDFRGHAPAVLQSVLEAQLPSLERCRLPPPEPPAAVHGHKPPVVRAGPVEATVEFVVSGAGAVATTRTVSSAGLSADCLQRQLLRVEFGILPGAATARETLVTATLRCTPTTCRWTWMPPEPD